MNQNSRLLPGGLLGGVTAFLTGWIIYGMLLKGFFANSMINYAGGIMKDVDHPGIKEWVALTLSQLSLGFLLAYVFSRFSSINAVKGLIAGGIIFLLISLFMNCSIFFQMNLFGKRLILTDAFVSFINGGIVGLITGWFMGRGATVNS